MKVIGIGGSSRMDGNTAIIMRLVLAELEASGIETELIQLGDKDILPCRGCFACRGRGNCVHSGDAFREIFDAMRGADGILLGSPVYSADVSAKMRALLERGAVVAAVNPGIFRCKVGAAVAAARRGGGLNAVDSMNHFFLNKEMIIAGSSYWNMVYGGAPGEVMNDAEGVDNMRNLGRNMAWLLRKIAGPSGNARPMRRAERELAGSDICREIISGNNRAVVSMVDRNIPYGVMMNYAPVFEDDRTVLLFHGAATGRKIDCVRENPEVSAFINDAAETLIVDGGSNGCRWSCRYRSVIVSGKMRLIEDLPGKRAAAERFMRHYSAEPLSFQDSVLNRTVFFELEAERISGKKN